MHFNRRTPDCTARSPTNAARPSARAPFAHVCAHSPPTHPPATRGRKMHGRRRAAVKHRPSAPSLQCSMLPSEQHRFVTPARRGPPLPQHTWARRVLHQARGVQTVRRWPGGAAGRRRARQPTSTTVVPRCPDPASTWGDSCALPSLAGVAVPNNRPIPRGTTEARLQTNGFEDRHGRVCAKRSGATLASERGLTRRIRVLTQGSAPEAALARARARASLTSASDVPGGRASTTTARCLPSYADLCVRTGDAGGRGQGGPGRAAGMVTAIAPPSLAQRSTSQWKGATSRFLRIGPPHMRTAVDELRRY